MTFGRDERKQENLEQEIETHLQMAAQDRIDRGASPRTKPIPPPAANSATSR